MKLIFEENATENVLKGQEFDDKIRFPKIRNLNRMKTEHRNLVYKIRKGKQ